MTVRKFFGRTSIAIGCALVAFGAWAESPTNLHDAVERSVLQNPDVKVRFNNLLASMEDKRAAEGGWRPRVDIEAASGQYLKSSPTQSKDLDFNGRRASIQLRQVLFDGFATRSEVKRLGFGEQAAFFELQAASNVSALEATRAYLDVQRYREFVTLAAENYSKHLEVRDKIGQKVKAGVGRLVDLEQASGRLALAESNWLTEVSNLHDVSARYQRLIGDVPAKELAALEPLDGFIPARSDFLAQAVHKSPEFRGAVATLRSFRADTEGRKAANYPTLELRARRSLETNQSGVVGEYQDTALELVLNYNVYHGSTDEARIKQSQAKLQAAFELRDKACRDGWQTAQIAFNDSLRIASQLKLLSAHELSTSKAQQAYSQQFDIGQRSLLDLLDTQNELYQARRSLTGAEYDQTLAQARVLSTAGALLDALNINRLAADHEEMTGGEADDELMQCNVSMLPTSTLNRTSNVTPVTAPK